MSLAPFTMLGAATLNADQLAIRKDQAFLSWHWHVIVSAVVRQGHAYRIA